MLINQDFAQSESKSPAKRSLALVVNEGSDSSMRNQTSDTTLASQLLQETITRIDGAYAPQPSEPTAQTLKT